MNIAYRCKLAGITQSKLAKDTGFSKSMISKWSCGYEIPITRSMKILADYFGITVEELLSDPEDIDLRGLKPEKSHESCENDQTRDHRARIEAALVKKVEELIPAIYDRETAEVVKSLVETIILLNDDSGSKNPKRTHSKAICPRTENKALDLRECDMPTLGQCELQRQFSTKM